MRKDEIGILVLHGIGDTKSDFAYTFIRNVRAEYERMGGKKHLTFQPVWWDSTLRGRQNQYWESTKTLPWSGIRRLVSSTLSDAISYQLGDSSDHKSYQRTGYGEIHALVDDGITKLSREMGVKKRAVPCAIAAYSLGSIIISNYIWDIQHPFSSGNEAYSPSSYSINIIQNTKLLFTMGSPIPLWALRYKDKGVPIDLDGMKWVNVMSKHDVLASPISDIGELWKSDKLKEEFLSVGPFPSRFTPLAHLHYLNDRKVAKRFAKELMEIN